MSGFGEPALLDNSAWARVLLGRLPAAGNTRWRQALRSGEIQVPSVSPSTRRSVGAHTPATS